ncbi:MAG: carboxymuconolactone decarboxylase family protein [Rhodospirillales bacterium]|nr:carboxymuconolactone decarboxylase family protein [Rhodospirillales bacterium]
MSRLPAITLREATSAQRAIFDAVTGGERARRHTPNTFIDARGGLAGPFNAWAHRPDLGDSVLPLGAQLRFRGELPGGAREIAILVVGATWKAEFEWWAHAEIARQEGVPEETLTAILNGETPSLSDPVEQAAYDVAKALLKTGKVDDKTYRNARELVGDGGLVELVTLVGYYTLVSFILNAFEVPLPEGETGVFAA